MCNMRYTDTQGDMWTHKMTLVAVMGDDKTCLFAQHDVLCSLSLLVCFTYF